ncbi:MAG: hemolysin secretion protein D, partial [Pseudomonadota bacterium]
MSSIWHTMKDILDRHRHVWRQSWQQRHQLESPALLTHEAQFLPAALALQETPVSPLPRVIAWVIITFVGIALGWAIISKIDVVAIAEGRIIPNDRSKNVQAFEISTVKKIQVAEGQAVQKGELLIELDNTNTDADLVRLQDNLFLAKAKIERARSFLNALANVNEKPDVLYTLKFASEDDRIKDIQHLFDGQLEEYRTKQQRIHAEIARRTAESQTILESIHKFEQILPLAKRREADFKNLWLKNLIAEHEYLEKEQIRVEQQSDLASGRATLLQNKASLLEAETQLKELHAQTRRTQLDV